MPRASASPRRRRSISASSGSSFGNAAALGKDMAAASLSAGTDAKGQNRPVICVLTYDCTTLHQVGSNAHGFEIKKISRLAWDNPTWKAVYLRIPADSNKGLKFVFPAELFKTQIHPR